MTSSLPPASPASYSAYVGADAPVVQPGEFVFAAAYLDQGHINGQCDGLINAGATLKWVYEPDPERLATFLKAYPQAQVARSFEEVLDDPQVQLVTGAGVTSQRGPIGCRVMRAGKHYFVDKAPFTTLAQLEEARAVAAQTGRKYMVYYSERFHNDSGLYAGELVHSGAIGRVLQVIGLGPHRLNKPVRPAWFFDKEQAGGILCDIGSHQFEQFLFYTGARDATVASAAVGNFANPETPSFDDFGECSLIGDNGASLYVRVDWFTPAGLKTFGDCRSLILGTRGYIELRKYADIGAENRAQGKVLLVDDKGEQLIDPEPKVGNRIFNAFLLDCLNGTELVMPQAHIFKAAELALRAQVAARILTPSA